MICTCLAMGRMWGCFVQKYQLLGGEGAFLADFSLVGEIECFPDTAHALTHLQGSLQSCFPFTSKVSNILWYLNGAAGRFVQQKLCYRMIEQTAGSGPDPCDPSRPFQSKCVTLAHWGVCVCV